jgi:hypothetical protein
LELLEQIERRCNSVHELGKGSFYSGWTTSIHYEESFRRFAAHELDMILDADVPPDKEAERIGRLNAKQWVGEAYSEQRTRVKTNYPQGTALNNIVDAFNELCEHLKALNEIRRRVPSLSLRRLAEALGVRRKAVEASQRWLKAAPATSAIEGALINKVAALFQEGVQA